MAIINVQPDDFVPSNALRHAGVIDLFFSRALSRDDAIIITDSQSSLRVSSHVEYALSLLSMVRDLRD